MTPNASYVCRYDLRLTNCDDVAVDIVRGRTYLSFGFSGGQCRVGDSVTGEVLKLPLHVARNPEWYFSKVGFGQNNAKPQVSQAEYVGALVKGNEGLDAGELYRTAQAEQFAPMGGKPIPYNGFTTILAKLTFVEMRKDGVTIEGTKETRGHVTGCTYHVKRAAAKNRDGLFAS